MGRKKKKKLMRHKVIPAAHLFLIKDGRILLLRRYNTGWEDGNYSVPAGHIEQEEPATKTMIRETKEEIKIEINPNNLSFCGLMHRKKPEGEERVDFFFTTNKWQGRLRIGELEKCDDLRWCSLDNLPKNIVAYIKVAIEVFKRGQIYSEFGWER